MPGCGLAVLTIIVIFIVSCIARYALVEPRAQRLAAQLQAIPNGTSYASLSGTIRRLRPAVGHDITLEPAMLSTPSNITGNWIVFIESFGFPFPEVHMLTYAFSKGKLTGIQESTFYRGL